MKVLDLETIQRFLDVELVLAQLEKAFIRLSAGEMTSPPVGLLKTPKGITHIKYGHIQGDPVFVIKIASSYHGNVARGLPSGSGLMVVLDANTGEALAILDDKGWLTDVRTALAGAIAVKHFGPDKIRGFGIVGTGVQARLQAEFIKPFIQADHVMLWGRDAARQRACADEIAHSGYHVEALRGEACVEDGLEKLVRSCNVIITTTPAEQPLIKSDWVCDDTLIVAVGADAPGKQELDADLVMRCEQIICDKVDQCLDHGELQTAHRSGHLETSKMRELGEVIQQGGQRRNCLTLLDLTGVAAQDIAIAQHVYTRWRNACL